MYYILHPPVARLPHLRKSLSVFWTTWRRIVQTLIISFACGFRFSFFHSGSPFFVAVRFSRMSSMALLSFYFVFFHLFCDFHLSIRCAVGDGNTGACVSVYENVIFLFFSSFRWKQVSTLLSSPILSNHCTRHSHRYSVIHGAHRNEFHTSRTRRRRRKRCICREHVPSKHPFTV